jgi:ABC-type polysaccharide/polyol phosphate export permease
MLHELREVLRYQNLVLQLVRRDILTRYKRSVLGIAWTMLNPLGTMLVLTIAFSRVFQTRGYAVFVLTGLLSWTFFAQTTNAITLHIVWGGSLFKRIYVPRTTFALAAIGTGLVNVVVSLVPLLIVMLATRVPLSPAILFLPVPILFLAMFSLGVGLLISTVAVYFADVAEMYQIVLTAWMYITPVIYPASYLPEQYRTWIAILNPMYHLVQIFRTPVYEGRLPTLPELLVSGGLSIGALLVGWYFFTKKSDEFAYRI